MFYLPFIVLIISRFFNANLNKTPVETIFAGGCKNRSQKADDDNSDSNDCDHNDDGDENDCDDDGHHHYIITIGASYLDRIPPCTGKCNLPSPSHVQAQRCTDCHILSGLS